MSSELLVIDVSVTFGRRTVGDRPRPTATSQKFRGDGGGKGGRGEDREGRDSKLLTTTSPPGSPHVTTTLTKV